MSLSQNNIITPIIITTTTTSHTTTSYTTKDMDDDDFSPDPELAAALGFSSFGAQPSTKRRKYNTYDAVVDVDVPHGSAANSLPLGQRPPKSSVIVDNATQNPSPLSKVAEEKRENAINAADGATITPAPLPTNPATSGILQDWDVETLGPRKFSQSELHALREGVRLPGGTITYFLPTFVEDPWKEG